MIDLPHRSYSVTELPDFVRVGKYSSIGKDVIFHRASDEHQCIVNRDCVYTTNWNQPGGAGEVIVGNDVWIGDGVRVMEDTEIGDGSIIGAGSVIHGHIEPYSVIVGNPGRVSRKRFDPLQIAALKKIKWWDQSPDKVEEMRGSMDSINLFIEKYG